MSEEKERGWPKKVQALEHLEYIIHYAKRLQDGLKSGDSEMILDSSDYLFDYQERLNALGNPLHFND